MHKFTQHLLTKDKDWKEAFGFPDFQVELSLSFTLDFTRTAQSKVIHFSCYHLFVLFLSQHLYILLFSPLNLL